MQDIKKPLRIRMAQLNFKIADFEANVDKMIEAMRKSQGVDLLVFSELALSGYAPLDLVNEPWFLQRQAAAGARLLQASMDFDGIIAYGLVLGRDGPGKPLTNSMLLVRKDEILAQYDKQLLPTYDVFDERRYFEPGKSPALVYPIKDVKVGFFICEDGWNDNDAAYADNPVRQAVEQGAELIVSLNASPSNLGKMEKRRKLFTAVSERHEVPLVYVNQVGGNDQVIYDGNSFVVANGEMLVADPFIEAIPLVELANGRIVGSSGLEEYRALRPEEFHLEQIKLGLRDYLAKTGFSKVLVGSSGGIDSAVTLALAVAALGAENVEAVTMPSAFSSRGSVEDSKRLCENLGVRLFYHPIGDLVDAECKAYKHAFGIEPTGLALENLQARLRGMTLMTRSNQSGSLLLTTGNKSELSVGYATLYGDMAGGLNLIGDLYKMEVYALARYINEVAQEPLIPMAIIEKAPSAELAPGQRDDDSLPPYPQLDAMLKLLIEKSDLPLSDLDCAHDALGGLDIPELDALRKRVSGMLARAEFKRRQAPPVIRCRALAFGSGRQMPIACVGS